MRVGREYAAGQGLEDDSCPAFEAEAITAILARAKQNAQGRRNLLSKGNACSANEKLSLADSTEEIEYRRFDI